MATKVELQEARTETGRSVAQIASYRDLLAWQKAMLVVETCYRVTRAFPRSERFGLTLQIRRAAVSVPANIAEGKSRRTTGSYLQHLCIAAGSHAELETLVELAKRLALMSPEDETSLISQTDAVGRLLTALIRSVRLKLPERGRSPRASAGGISS